MKHNDTTATAGTATGGVRQLLRLEGFGVLIAALLLYAQHGAGWGLFAATFLLPDLAFLAFLAGARVGALAYNATHSYIGPLLAAAASHYTGLPLTVSLVWAAHVGFDRALGYGLKYAKGFGFTHLGRVGRSGLPATAS